MEDRLAFSLLNLFGRDVQVTKTNGCRLDGVFCAASADKSGFSLRYCKHVEGEKPDVAFAYRDRVRVAWGDVETLVALRSGGSEGHSFDPAAVAAPLKKRSVVTDSSIAAKANAAAAPRAELQAVDPEWLSPATAAVGGSKGGDANGAPWDQFETNRTKFNVPSTFKPDMYTTELRREDFTQEQLKRAQELERGIESKSSVNAHVREERGQTTDGDEEERFGAVNKKPASSWASMVKGSNPPPTVAVSSPPPASKPVAASKPAPATTSKRSAPAATAVTSSKKREEEIRGFKEFSQTYQSPSIVPKIRKGTPPPSLALDQPAAPASVTAAAAEQPTPPTEKKKFTLNAKAKQFTPTLPLPAMLPPRNMPMHMPHPGYYPPPPPPPPYYAQGMPPPPPYFMYAAPRYFPPPPQYAMYPPPHVPIPPPHPETYAAQQQAQATVPSQSLEPAE